MSAPERYNRMQATLVEDATGRKTMHCIPVPSSLRSCYGSPYSIEPHSTSNVTPMCALCAQCPTISRSA